MDETPKKTWTYDDLLAMPEDGKRYEIIDGELIEMTSPIALHQQVSVRLAAAFLTQLRGVAKVFAAPLDVIFTRTRVVQPDVIAIRNEHREIIRDHIYGVPDLLVEILSPSNTKHDLVTKRRLYARNRVPEYWVINPEAQTIEVLELVEGGLSYRQHGWYGPGDRARSATMPIEVVVDALFADE